MNIKPLYFSRAYPGYGHRGGGAETNTYNVISGLQRSLGDKFDPQVQVIHSKDPEANSIDYVESPTLTPILREDRNVIHLPESTIILRQKYAFIKLAASGIPIIQRVTLPERVGMIVKEYGGLHNLPENLRFVSQTPLMTHVLVEAGFERNNIFEITNGVDTKRFSPVKYKDKERAMNTIGIEPDVSRPTVLTIARVHDESKRIRSLCELWERAHLYNDYRLLVVGGKLDTNYSGVHFVGEVPYSMIDLYHQASDIYVHPSVNEGFSNAMAEAAASGMPIIAREGVSGNNLIVQHNTNGYLFESEDQIAEYLHNLKNTELRLKFGVKSVRHALEKLSSDVMISRNLRMYEDLIL